MNFSTLVSKAETALESCREHKTPGYRARAKLLANQAYNVAINSKQKALATNLVKRINDLPKTSISRRAARNRKPGRKPSGIRRTNFMLVLSEAERSQAEEIQRFHQLDTLASAIRRAISNEYDAAVQR